MFKRLSIILLVIGSGVINAGFFAKFARRISPAAGSALSSVQRHFARRSAMFNNLSTGEKVDRVAFGAVGVGVVLAQASGLKNAIVNRMAIKTPNVATEQTDERVDMKKAERAYWNEMRAYEECYRDFGFSYLEAEEMAEASVSKKLRRELVEAEKAYYEAYAAYNRGKSLGC